jgi:lipoate-protein ligase B
MPADGVHVALGRRAFPDVLRLQRTLRALRQEGRLPDTVLTVEHEPVLTLGRRGSLDDLRVPRSTLEREGIEIHRIERGGGITYHGPGQLVAYPIVDLTRHGRDLHAFIHRLEAALLAVAQGYGVSARRRPGHPGVWVEGRKLASLGIHVRRWVTSHGVALNVDVNRRHFAMIRPCGESIEIVSLADLVSSAPTMDDVEARLVQALEELFDWRLERRAAAWLTGRIG